jgi:hypothetical protein
LNAGVAEIDGRSHRNRSNVGRSCPEGAISYLVLMAGEPESGDFQSAAGADSDGGVILMLLVEMLMRRDLTEGQETVVKVGFVFLMFVVVFVIYNDIARFSTRLGGATPPDGSGSKRVPTTPATRYKLISLR